MDEIAIGRREELRRQLGGAGAWVTEAAGVPRASDGAGPSGGRSDAAEFSRTPSRLRLCERLACPTERLQGESEITAVHRFTSGTDEAAPTATVR